MPPPDRPPSLPPATPAVYGARVSLSSSLCTLSLPPFLSASSHIPDGDEVFNFPRLNLPAVEIPAIVPASACYGPGWKYESSLAHGAAVAELSRSGYSARVFSIVCIRERGKRTNGAHFECAAHDARIDAPPEVSAEGIVSANDYYHQCDTRIYEEYARKRGGRKSIAPRSAEH